MTVLWDFRRLANSVLAEKGITLPAPNPMVSPAQPTAASNSTNQASSTLNNNRTKEAEAGNACRMEISDNDSNGSSSPEPATTVQSNQTNTEKQPVQNESAAVENAPSAESDVDMDQSSPKGPRNLPTRRRPHPDDDDFVSSSDSEDMRVPRAQQKRAEIPLPPPHMLPSSAFSSRAGPSNRRRRPRFVRGNRTSYTSIHPRSVLESPGDRPAGYYAATTHDSAVVKRLREELKAEKEYSAKLEQDVLQLREGFTDLKQVSQDIHRENHCTPDCFDPQGFCNHVPMHRVAHAISAVANPILLRKPRSRLDDSSAANSAAANADDKQALHESLRQSGEM